MSYYRTNDGTIINYYEKGQGQPIIFLPGWTMFGQLFKHQLNDLSNEFHVLTIDPRGQGDSDKNNVDQVSSKLWAEDLHELILQRELKDIIVVGWSMGAWTAWHYCNLFNCDHLQGLIVLEMSPYLGEPGWADEENASMAKDRQGALSGFVTGLFKEEPSELQWMIEHVMKTPLKVAQKVQSEMEGDLRSILNKVTVPSITMYGKESPFFTEEQQEETSSLMKAKRKVIFDNSAHCPFWEEPQSFNEEVRKFAQNLA